MCERGRRTTFSTRRVIASRAGSAPEAAARPEASLTLPDLAFGLLAQLTPSSSSDWAGDHPRSIDSSRRSANRIGMIVAATVNSAASANPVIISIGSTAVP